MEASFIHFHKLETLESWKIKLLRSDSFQYCKALKYQKNECQIAFIYIQKSGSKFHPCPQACKFRILKDKVILICFLSILQGSKILKERASDCFYLHTKIRSGSKFHPLPQACKFRILKDQGITIYFLSILQGSKILKERVSDCFYELAMIFKNLIDEVLTLLNQIHKCTLRYLMGRWQRLASDKGLPEKYIQ